jgi:hypothetical protein
MTDKELLKLARGSLEEAESCINMLKERGWHIEFEQALSCGWPYLKRPLAIKVTKLENLDA